MSRRSPKTDFDYQAATLDDIRGRPVEDCKPTFHALSRDYFAREAHQHFATEAAAFFLLMLTTVLPLFDGANAVVELIRSTGEHSDSGDSLGPEFTKNRLNSFGVVAGNRMMECVPSPIQQPWT